MHSLPLFLRIADRPIILVGEGEAAEAKRRMVERAGGRVVGAEDGAARLAFVALDAPAAAVAQLRSRGILINVVDRPDLCDFTVPSLLERGPVLIAIGTGGVSAGLAKALRLRLDGLVPASLGVLAGALGQARAALRGAFPSADARRAALDHALSAGGLLDPLADHAPDAVPRWLDGASAPAAALREFVFAGDDPDDLTLRQARWLGRAGVLAYEPGVPAAVLDRARADARRFALTPGQPVPALAGEIVIIRRG